MLRITEQGEEFVRHLLPKLFAPLREMLKEFSETEQRQLNAQLKRLGFELEQVSATVVAERAV